MVTPVHSQQATRPFAAHTFADFLIGKYSSGYLKLENMVENTK